MATPPTPAAGDEEDRPQIMADDPIPRGSFRKRDSGCAPAAVPGAVHHNNNTVSSAMATGSHTSEPAAARRTSDASTLSDEGQVLAKREARRSRRASTREKFGRASVSSTCTETRTSANSAASDTRTSIDSIDFARNIAAVSHRQSMQNLIREDSCENDDDGVDDERPGSFAVSGPGLRRSQLERKPTVEENDDLAEQTVITVPTDTTERNLPVAWEAEVVENDFSKNMVVVAAQKDDENRNFPVKWLIIGGCLMFVAAVVISVSIGVVLGSRDSSSTNSVVGLSGAGAPTNPPEGIATRSPGDSSPNLPPAIPVPPTGPDTLAPVDPEEPAAPTSRPAVEPATAPVETPGAEPTSAPVQPSVVPAQPTPASVATPAPVQSSPENHPLYIGDDGLKCQCRWYLQDFVMKTAADWSAGFSQQQLNKMIDIFFDSFDLFNPYPLRRLRTNRRQLIPTTYSYSIDVDGPKKFGTPSNGSRFGIQVEYSFEFCVDDQTVLDEYHSAFQTYFSSSEVLDNLGAAMQVASLVGVTFPVEPDRVCVN